MGAVCSAGMVEGNARHDGKLKKDNSFMNRKGEGLSDSKSDGQGKKQKKQDHRLSIDSNLSTSTTEGRKQVNLRGSFLGRASERAVEVLDTLGSGMTKFNTSSGFVSGMASRGNRISILAFEVANTITKGATLFQSLSEENIWFLKNEVLQSKGVQQLVSTDMEELLSLAEADKREEINLFSREVARFGNMCKDPQWHNLDRYFSSLDLDDVGDKQLRVEAEKIMQEFSSLIQHTSELYHELNSYERFEQDYQQKIKEMESLNIPLKGESITIFQSELKHQRKAVRILKKKSLWSKHLEEIVEKLVDIVTYILQAIHEFLGNNGISSAKDGKGPQRLGQAGLALHYANIINQINTIASRPTSLPPSTRDSLYHSLPNNIKSALPSKVQTISTMKELSVTKIKAEMNNTLQWLVPFATNTIRAHQGFGWVGEWANTSHDLSDDSTARESSLIRLQTLYYADKQKIDNYIIELLAWLHHLISFVRSRQNTMNPMPTRSPPKGLNFQSNKMIQFLSVDRNKNRFRAQLSKEDRRLLEEVIAKRKNPGISKSENFGLPNKKEARDLHRTRSVGSSPIKDFFANSTTLIMEHQNVLDVMDGLAY
ncbi:hypothetical protein TanjilG_12345 [Lupinus angustifolius]|uniref:DUF668 domain-containing protein n=1 Tax=Lupinus angustifolius TaxID=3871 RepID=A0A4P1QY31_LUPAN|nr:PREDICTED: uncharacterized protein LOC109327098 [Lupinus angustifolius]OIV97588.1 hypothetical protein TanjilG_12345 [Lupinus angustifolius]